MAMTLPTLDQIDPAEAWKPWQPTAADPWGPKWVAHLYRRAAFGHSREEILEAERLGLEGTLDLLFRGKPHAEEIEQTLIDSGRVAAEREESGELLRGWWLYCMLQGGHPLREKMTLFWHNHFATSIAKVQSAALMFRQNCLLRKHALGRFGPLLQAVSRDPAMMIWLDSNNNVKGKPNENYARELMELFSLGVGNYTEKDIREAARALTGWRTDGVSFTFDARFHDRGPKTILEQTGHWNGGDVVRIVLEQPAAARFLVRKFYNFLIDEEASPPDALLEPLYTSFRKSDYDIAGLVRAILTSRHFYSSHAFRNRVKGPVEFVLGAVQAVYRPYGEGDPDFQPLPPQVLVGWQAVMGQQLFAPPNVKGWPGGRTWFNTHTLLERGNFAAALATGSLWTAVSRGSSPPATPASSELPEEPAPPRAYDPARFLEEDGRVGRPAPRAATKDVVRILIDHYLPGGVRPGVESKLAVFLAEGNPTGPALARRVREAVHAILTMAEYQLA